MFWVAIDDNDRVIDTALLKTVEMKNKGIQVSLVRLGEPKE